MRRRAGVWVALWIVVVFTAGAMAADPPSDEKKRTSLNKYVTAMEAYEMWKADPQKVKIVDVRTPEEYVFVGHPAMAVNIPLELWTGEWNAEKKDFPLAPNPNFEAQVKARFQPNDVLLVMCRSGHRAAKAIERLVAAGFTNVYNIVDGFEGDKIKDPESYYDGKRMKNGWKNSGAPWTYSLDPQLVFIPKP
ncbi:MAG: rhodanese-like domain-containing protein [Desulfosoma sp.]|uniref:rhodanese-like domain-containing protein n=1 Tax=Desulfosoma sp. TaxID=2603217 RepID=UPI00404ABBD6